MHYTSYAERAIKISKRTSEEEETTEVEMEWLTKTGSNAHNDTKGNMESKQKEY